jgi:error-prone DNA polymerase
MWYCSLSGYCDNVNIFGLPTTQTTGLVFQTLLICINRKAILQSSLLMVEGKLQIEGDVIYVIVSSCYDLTQLLHQLTADRNKKLPLQTLSRADEGSRPAPSDQVETKPQNTQLKLFPEARNFK